MNSEKIIKLEAEGEGEVVEYCVAIGDTVIQGDSLLVLESDKATMEIPATMSGVVTKWLVNIGDSISQEAELALMSTSALEPEQQSASDTLPSDQKVDAEAAIGICAKDNKFLPKNSGPAVTKDVIISLDAEGEGEVVEYSVAVGDELEEGTAILVVESDKAAMDIPTSNNGILKKWLVDIGDSVSQGDQLAIISVTSEPQIASVDEHQFVIENKSTARKTIALPASSQGEVSHTEVSEHDVSVSNRRTSAGPAVRKLAREMAVDLSLVVGSAYRGRVLKEDVKSFVKCQMLNGHAQKDAIFSTSQAIAPLPSIDFSQFGEIEKHDMSAIAKATAAHMTRCWLNIPHVTLHDEVDITELEAFRSSIDPAEFKLERKPTILPFIVMIVAKALRKHPKFNSSLDPERQQLIYKKYVNIGIAVDTPAGLLVPVIRNADTLSISELSVRINDLAVKAKNRKLSVDEMTGGCFTISSLGPIGGTGFTPIVNGPEVAILGVASAEVKPVWDCESFKPRKKLPLCLSFDHRVINGADAGKFMAMIHQYIEQIGKIIL
jgi:pyruvate dehydrogenase E2 component (dihydrolipoamide acetyltransferase)